MTIKSFITLAPENLTIMVPMKIDCFCLDEVPKIVRSAKNPSIWGGPTQKVEVLKVIWAGF